MGVAPSALGLGLSTLGGWVMLLGCATVHVFRLWEKRFAPDRRRRRLASAPASRHDASRHDGPAPDPSPDRPPPPPADPTPFIRAAGLTDVAEAGAGLEFAVFRCRSPAGPGPLALRIPHSRIVANANDPHLDARALLAQELAIYGYLSGSAVPVPAPHGLLDAEAGACAMLASFVESDGSSPSPRELGRVLGALHALPPPPDFVPVVCEGGDALETIATRLPRRWGELAALVPGLPRLPDKKTLLCYLSSLRRFPPSLLHLDFRIANLRVEKGRITGVVDWENALLGPPAVELCRLRETAHPGDGFEDGYAETAPEVPELSPMEEIVLRLDSAVMLALVFLSEAPHPDRGKTCLGKVRRLVERLAREADKEQSHGHSPS